MEQQEYPIEDAEQAIEWIKTQLILPEDEYDEDDELDDRINEIEKKKKEKVIRGKFFGI